MSTTDPALNKFTADFETAFNGGDMVKVAALHTDDAVVMPPDEQMVKGRSAIEARLKSREWMGKVTLKLSPSESAISGDHAHEAGILTVTLPHGITESEKYLHVYKRVGGAWEIAYSIWNSNAPPNSEK